MAKGAHSGRITRQSVTRSSAGTSYVAARTWFFGSGSGWGAPQNLQAFAISTSQIDLTWDTVFGASGYDVERDGVVIAQDVADESYSDTGLASSTSYTYRVRAVA